MHIGRTAFICVDMNSNLCRKKVFDPTENGDASRGALSTESVQRSLDFVHAQINNGQKIRALTVTGQMVDLWAYHNTVRMDFSRPAAPTDNAHIEAHNGSLRDACLNVRWFETLTEAQEQIEWWRRVSEQSRFAMVNVRRM